MKNRIMRLAGATCWLAFAGAAFALDLSKVPASDWIDLFNGKDLDGWVPKVKGAPAGQDPYRTWYVKDGMLTVDYAGYAGAFNNRFGHMAWQKRKFSYYLIHAEADTWGTQATGAPDWAYQNNGLMLHSQSMESMAIDQDFPTSVECQLLGSMNKQNSDGKTENGTTANLCGNSSNTTMIVNGSRQSPGCFTAKHVKIDSSHFQVVEALVLGDSLVKHMVAADTGKPMDTVLTYTQLQTRNDGKPLTEGYIAIQGESAPWKFRKIRVLDLAGCMDPKSASYRSYFLKSDPSRCTATAARAREPQEAITIRRTGAVLEVAFSGNGPHEVLILDASGRIARSTPGRGPGVARIPLAGYRPGLYVVGVREGGRAYRKSFALL